MGFKGPTLLYGLHYKAKNALKLITVVHRPYNRAQVRRGGRGQQRFSQKPKFHIFFFEAFPK